MSRLRARFPERALRLARPAAEPGFLRRHRRDAERHVAPAHQHPRPARLLAARARMPFAICAALRVSYAELGIADFNRRLPAATPVGRPAPLAQGRHDASSTHLWTRSQQRRPARRPTAASWRCCAHDIRGALQGVLGGIGQIEARRARRRGARSRSSASRPRPGRSPAWSATLLGEEPDAGRGRDEPRRASTRFLALPAPPLRRRGARAAASRFAVEAERRAAGGAAARPGAARRASLGNLIGNAHQVHRRRHRPPRPSRATPDGGVAFRVADDGPGLRRRLDGASARLPAGAADKPGHGLGLHIVQALTDRLGGRDRPRQPRRAAASRRCCAFPRALCAAARRRGRPSPRRAPTSPGLRVLLAEDNPTNQMVATQMLRALNAEVTVCVGRRRGARALRGGARSTWWWSTSRCRGCPAST